MNITKEELIKRFDGTSTEPNPSLIVVHFKEIPNRIQKNPLPLAHFCYVILDVASSSDDPNIKYVVYQNLETGCVWVREINDFFEYHDVLFPSGRSDTFPRFAEAIDCDLAELKKNPNTIHPKLRDLIRLIGETK
jgi:hypothetical protein